MEIVQGIFGKIIAEIEHESCVFRLYEKRVYHVIIKKNVKVNMDFVNRGYAFLDEHGGGEFYNIYEFTSFSDVEPEVREWAASPSNNSYTKIDAILINSLPQKILADFYIRINKPIKPTKVFTSMDKAIEWVNRIINDEL